MDTGERCKSVVKNVDALKDSWSKLKEFIKEREDIWKEHAGLLESRELGDLVGVVERDVKDICADSTALVGMVEDLDSCLRDFEGDIRVLERRLEEMS